MIESLYIENFAIIDQVQIDFQSGMTVLTGETGAGKSIIIDAIGQLIGQRSQPSFVKNGADYAFIEGVFSSNKEISFLNTINSPKEQVIPQISSKCFVEKSSLVSVAFAHVIRPVKYLIISYM